MTIVDILMSFALTALIGFISYETGFYHGEKVGKMTCIEVTDE